MSACRRGWRELALVPRWSAPPLFWPELVSKTGSIIDLGIEHKILEKKGAWISFEGELVGQGRDAAKTAVRDNPALAEKLTKAIMDKVTVTGGTAVTGDDPEE